MGADGSTSCSTYLHQQMSVIQLKTNCKDNLLLANISKAYIREFAKDIGHSSWWCADNLNASFQRIYSGSNLGQGIIPTLYVLYSYTLMYIHIYQYHSELMIWFNDLLLLRGSYNFGCPQQQLSIRLHPATFKIFSSIPLINSLEHPAH